MRIVLRITSAKNITTLQPSNITTKKFTPTQRLMINIRRGFQWHFKNEFFE